MRALRTIVLGVFLGTGCDEASSETPEATTATEGSTSTGAENTTGSPADPEGSGTTMAPSSSSSGSSAGGTSGASGPAEPETGGSEETSGGSTGSGGMADVWDPEFAWVADFIREKCVACHDMGQNGNIVFPSVEMTNDQVMQALDGGVATNGNLFIEPGNAVQSQVYIMITNEAGEQFPMETTDRVAAWIDSGAPYLAP